MSSTELNEQVVLAKAVLNVAHNLGLTVDELAKIISSDLTSIREGIDPATKSGELALLLIRFYRSLYNSLGGNTVQMKHWLVTNNKHLNDVPKELINSEPGLNTVIVYLERMSGKL